MTIKGIWDCRDTNIRGHVYYFYKEITLHTATDKNKSFEIRNVSEKASFCNQKQYSVQ